MPDLTAALATLRDEAAGNERARRLSPASVEALASTGVFRMAMGRRLGGPELDPVAQIELLESISTADPSAGWCAMIGSDGGYATAHLDESVAREMYPSLDVPTALNANPGGQATVVDGGFELRGRWPFGSGSTHSAWLFLHAFVVGGDGAMRMLPSGLPDMRMLAVAGPDVTIVDTWDTTGLAGSGSHDIEVHGVFVPTERTYSLLGAEAVDPAPLYRHPWMFFVNIAAVPLGVGRAAVAEAARVAAGKVALGSMTTAAEDPVVAIAMARAEVLVASARAYLLDTVTDVWAAILEGADHAPAWVRFRLATTNAFHAVKEAVGLLYEALGTSGIYRRSLLDRWYRDIATMTQHTLAQTKTLVPAGRALLGLDPQAIAF